MAHPWIIPCVQDLMAGVVEGIDGDADSEGSDGGDGSDDEGAAGGKGGVEAEAVGRLVKQLGGGLRQLVFVSSHGALALPLTPTLPLPWSSYPPTARCAQISPSIS